MSAQEPVHSNLLQARLWPVLRVLRALLFGFDVFISYGHGPESTPFARRLESSLRRRDFVVFRDESEIELGGVLSRVIGLALRRSRTLVVVVSSEATESHWVTKEIDLFASRRRPVCAIDIDGLRDAQKLGQLRDRLADRLMADDDDRGPSDAPIEQLIRGSSGARANRLARATLVSLALVGLATAGVIGQLALSLRERSLDLLTTATLRIAEAHHDPLTQSLLLAELDPARLPVEADALARRVAEEEIPTDVLRRVPLDFEEMLFTPDGRHIITLGYATINGQWSVVVHRVDVDDRFEPEILAVLPDWTIGRYGITMDGLAVFVADDERMAIVPWEGEARLIDPPTQDDVDAWCAEAQAATGEFADPPIIGEWTGDRAWAPSAVDGPLLFVAERGVLVVDGSTGSLVHADGLGGRSVLAVRHHATSAGELGATLVCEDGVVFHMDSTWRALPAADLTTEDERIESGLIDVHGRAAALVTSDDEPESNEHLVVYDPDVGTRRSRIPANVDRWHAARARGRALLHHSDGTIGVLDLRTLDHHPQPESTVVRVLDSAEFLSGSYELESQPLSFDTDDASFSDDGSAVLIPGLRSSMLWRPGNPEPPRRLAANNLIDASCQAAWSGDGRTVAIAEHGAIRLWSIEQPVTDPTRIKLPGTGGRLVARGDSILASCDNGQLAIIGPDLAGARKLPMSDDINANGSAIFSESGSVFATLTEDGQIAIVGSDGSLVGSLPVQDKVLLYADARLSDNVLCFSDPTDPTTIIRWRFRGGTGSIRHTHSEPVVAWELVPETEELFTLDSSVVLRRLTVSSEEVLGQAGQARGETVWEIVVAPDGRRVLAGVGRFLIGWERETGLWSAENEFRNDEFWSPAIIGDRFVVGTETGRLGVGSFASQDVESWLVSPELRQPDTLAIDGQIAHVGMISEVISGPELGLVVTAGAMDLMLRVWDLDTGLIGRLPIRDIPREMLFLDDGRLATTSEDGVLSIWTLRPDHLLEKLVTRTSAVLLPAERSRYLGEDDAKAWRMYEDAERANGREPLSPERLIEVDIEF
ncbi:MAG: TIR domain-containing protein [Planctomycetota bacterium]